MNTLHFISMVGAISLTILFRPVRELILDWLEEKEDAFWDKMPWRKNKVRKRSKPYNNITHNIMYGSAQQYTKRHLVKEAKTYSHEELASLNNEEVAYISNALKKDDILKQFNFVFRDYRSSTNFEVNHFEIIKNNDNVFVTIRIFVPGEERNPAADEVYAQRMRFILNLLPFMADV